MEKPLVNKKYKLEKFPGKGGWTFARIPEVLQDKQAPFGWVRVRGSIDGVEFSHYHLMPMGDGKLFLPVKAATRKKIGKSEGDQVHVILYPDDRPLDIPEELQHCLRDEPAAYETFLGYTDGEKKAFIDWIYAAKKEVTRIERMAATIRQLLKKRKFAEMDREPAP